MAEVFVLRNQHGAYLNKQQEWISFGDTKGLFRSDQRDELINEKVELTVKAPELRIQLVEAIQGDNGRILVDGKECLPRDNPNPPEDEDQMSLSMETGETASDESSSASSVSNPIEEGRHVLDQVVP